MNDNFPIDEFVSILKKNYKKWNTPITTLLAKQKSNPFEILISTLLSLRTKDEVTARACEKLFKKARAPESIVKLSIKELEKLIYPVGFYRTKAKRIVEVSKIILRRYKGIVPDSLEELLELPGVGRKTANLVLIEGFAKPGICVDTHVHRISNRIGYIKTKNPDKTEFVLREKLPHKYWIKYNEMLVSFGQGICKPISPLCSKCPVCHICRKINVERSR